MNPHCPSRQNSVSGLHSTAAHGSPRHSLTLQFGSFSGQRQVVFCRWSHPVVVQLSGAQAPIQQRKPSPQSGPSAQGSTQTPVASSQYCPSSHSMPKQPVRQSPLASSHRAFGVMHSFSRQTSKHSPSKQRSPSGQTASSSIKPLQSLSTPSQTSSVASMQ